MFLLVYFQWLYLLELFLFACLLILGGLKVKNYLKINMLIIKMNIYNNGSKIFKNQK